IFSSNSSMVEHIDNLIKHYPKTWREVFVSNKHENFDDKKHLEKVLK
ncbi:cell division protein FtsK, partial [Helicobacter pylori]|nr:cell division protein FtsK [Helicobacter pylori]